MRISNTVLKITEYAGGSMRCRECWKGELAEKMSKRQWQREKEIEYYHESKPFPGCLILGFSRKIPIHVVVSIDSEESIAYVVTSYVPDTNYFEEDLKTRKKRGEDET